MSELKNNPKNHLYCRHTPLLFAVGVLFLLACGNDITLTPGEELSATSTSSAVDTPLSGLSSSTGLPGSSGAVLPGSSNVLSSGLIFSSAQQSSEFLNSSSFAPISSSSIPAECAETPLGAKFSFSGTEPWINAASAIPSGSLQNGDVVVVVGDDPSSCGRAIENISTWGFNVRPLYTCTTGSNLSVNKVTGDCVSNQLLGGAGITCLVEGVYDISNTRTDIQAILSKAQFDAIFVQRCQDICQSHAGQVFTYEGFIMGASHFPTFAATGTDDERKREIAAFLANASHETTGGWTDAPGGEQSWGLCFPEEKSYYQTSNLGYLTSQDASCQAASGKSYHGRGAIQLSYPPNYCRASRDLFGDQEILRLNPEKVLQDAETAWGTGLWFWMNEDVIPGTGPYNGVPPSGVYYKPSSHMVMTGTWTPRAEDIAAKRTEGFGVTINIINGGLECGGAVHTGPADRIAYFQRYAGILGISAVPNTWNGSDSDYLECSQQTYFQ